jgi:hypothetical protein
MKFTITMKDPDGFANSLMEAAREHTEILEDEEERDIIIQEREDKLRGFLKTWFEYDEYLTVEVDTVAKTCTVVPRKP